MDRLIEIIANLLANLFPSLFKNETGSETVEEDVTELRFFRDRKEFAATKIWLLDIFEKHPDRSFTTSELYDLWMPLIINRTEATDKDITQDSCFMRLQDLVEKRFIEMPQSKR